MYIPKTILQCLFLNMANLSYPADHRPSHEQQQIITAVGSGHYTCITVDAVAGSGKTSTVLWLAETYRHKHVMQVTYNAQLKAEVRVKANHRQLDNLEINTYHSLAVKYYDPLSHKDQALRKMLGADQALRARPQVDILVIDETQDMTPLYFALVKKFLRDAGLYPVILVLGDQHQGVYGFNSADTRFLTLASEIWQRPQAITLKLRTSYRVTHQIAAFVNEVMLGEPRILAVKNGPKVEYIRQDKYAMTQTLLDKLLTLLRSGTVQVNDIFILTPSVKNRAQGTPLQILENLLVKHNIKCYISMDDNKKLNEKAIQDKVVFSTFHQAKGRERKVVVIYNFDAGYFEYFARDCSPLNCPSTMYVAATRSMEYLFVLDAIRDTKSQPLPFLKKTHQELQQCSYMQFTGVPYGQPVVVAARSTGEHNTSPTELVRFLKEDILEQVTAAIEQMFTCVQPVEQDIKIPLVIKGEHGTTEEVSHLNGIMLPAMYEALTTGRCTVLEYVDAEMKKVSLKNYIGDEYRKIARPPVTPAHYMHLSNFYDALRSGYQHKIAQVLDYGWCSEEMAYACHLVMQKHLPPTGVLYEYNLGVMTEGKGYVYVHDYVYQSGEEVVNSKVIFRGVVDAVDPATVWEFKCVDALGPECYLQVVVYAWLWRKCMLQYGRRDFKLMNVRTGEVQQLDTESPLIEPVMQLLLKNKYTPLVTVNNEVFIRNCVAMYS